MANNKLAFVMMLDTSGSMDGCIDLVKIDAKAFVRQGRVGDQFAINQFSDNAGWVYPTGSDPRLITITEGLYETQKATGYIEALSTHNMTNMGEAIVLGNNILERSDVTAGLRAYVILSDGRHNQGVDPVSVLGNEPPVYIAAIGYVSKSYFDRLVVKNNKSRFYNEPSAHQMMKMFNYIVADANENELILNTLDSYQQGSDYLIKEFTITAGDNCSQLNVVWSNKNYRYTDGYPRGYNVNVILIDPDDNETDIKPDIAEEGYCIYNLENMKPGVWKILIQYSTTESITGTIGGVDFYTDIKTNLILPKSIHADEALKVRVSALKGSDIMNDTRVTAEISTPFLSEEEINDKYAAQIEAIQSEQDSANSSEPTNTYDRLRSEIMQTEGRDIYAKKVSVHQLALSSDGEYVLEKTEGLKSGVTNVTVCIEGVDPKTNIPFTRLRAGSIFIV